MKNETVNWDNYEEYLILEVDGELDEAGRKALQAFITANPEVQEELTMYEDVKLVPDANITFEGKEALLKRAPKVLVLSSRKWLYAAAAILAGVAIVLPVFWKGDVSTTELARIAEQEVKVPAAPVHAAQSNPAPGSPTVEVKHSELVAKKASVKAIITPQQTTLPQQEALASLDANTTVQQLPTSHSVAIVGEQVLPIVQATAAIANDVKQAEERGPIRFAAQNTAAFQNIKNAVAANVEKIEHAKKLFKETALNLKMAGRNITINF